MSFHSLGLILYVVLKKNTKNEERLQVKCGFINIFYLVGILGYVWDLVLLVVHFGGKKRNSVPFFCLVQLMLIELS